MGPLRSNTIRGSSETDHNEAPVANALLRGYHKPLAARGGPHRIPVAFHHGLIFTERSEFEDPLARFLDDHLCIGNGFNSFVVQLIIRSISLMSQIVETEGDCLEFFCCGARQNPEYQIVAFGSLYW